MTDETRPSNAIDLESMQGESSPVVANVTPSGQIGNNATEGEDTDGRKRKRKTTSGVWEYFDKVTIKGRERALCKGCKNDYVGGSKSGTTHLWEHLKKCLKTTNKVDIAQSFLKGTIKKDSTSITVGKYKFSQDLARHELCNMIALHGYPLSMVDHIGFIRYSKVLNPDFKVVSRNTLKSDIMAAYKEERECLKRLIASQEGRVAITTDMWTAKHQKRGYMAVTAHFIDEEWTLQSRIIR